MCMFPLPFQEIYLIMIFFFDLVNIIFSFLSEISLSEKSYKPGNSFLFCQNNIFLRNLELIILKYKKIRSTKN